MELCAEYTDSDHFLIECDIPGFAPHRGDWSHGLAVRAPKEWLLADTWRAIFSRVQEPLLIYASTFQGCAALLGRPGSECPVEHRRWLADLVLSLIHI